MSMHAVVYTDWIESETHFLVHAIAFIHYGKLCHCVHNACKVLECIDVIYNRICS